MLFFKEEGERIVGYIGWRDVLSSEFQSWENTGASK